MWKMKRAVFIEKLGELQRSEPEVSMVSSLDLGGHSKYGKLLVLLTLSVILQSEKTSYIITFHNII